MPDFCTQEALEWEKIQAKRHLSGSPNQEPGERGRCLFFPSPHSPSCNRFQARSEGAKAGRIGRACRRTSPALLGWFGGPLPGLDIGSPRPAKKDRSRNRTASVLRQRRRRFSSQAQAPSAKEQAAEPTAEATPPLPARFLGLSHALLRYWRAWERKAGIAAQIPPFFSRPLGELTLCALGQHPSRKDPQLTWGHSCFFRHALID